MLKKLIILSLLLQVFFVGGAYSQKQIKHYPKHYSKKQKKKTEVAKKFENKVVTEEPLKQDELNPKVEPVANPTPTPESITDKTDKSEKDLNPTRFEVDKNENFGRDIQGGNVVVKVTSNGNANVKLGMASRGVTIIEFPFNDPIYKIYPGDENFVSIDCGTRDKDNNCTNSPTDSLVLRPGKLFNQWGSFEEDAATVVTVQRQSGIVVSFIVIPVKTFANHAFHVVCRYDLAEVIAQRKAAGLPFNLNSQRDSQGNLNKIPSGVEVDASLKNQTGDFQNASFETPVEKSADDSTESLEQRTISELKKVARSNARLNFTKPVHGLSVAVATQDYRTADEVIEVVAVRNTTDKPIRLVPDQPELFVDSINEKEKEASVTSERLKIMMQATTAQEDDVLKPNEVYYFAFAYKTPILGAKQVLKIAFAQREAADEPSSATLLGLKR